MEFDPSNPEGLKALNSHLAENSFLSGYSLSSKDAAVFEKFVSAPDNAQFPHVRRWFNTVFALTEYELRSLKGDSASSGQESDAEALSRKQRKEEEKAAKAAHKAAKEAKKAALSESLKSKESKAVKAATLRDQQEGEFVNTTEPGQLKSFAEEMAKAYSPKQVEAAWDSWWEKHYYAPKLENSKNGTFVMVIPPPNVTGSLHLGHALTLTIEDAITRYHRMNQRTVLWVPGCDHAGIATQVVVEKQIMKLEGKTRWDFTRDEFVKRVWTWKEQYGDRIYTQIRRMGASVDWSRAAFTMDDPRSKAVTEAFVKMFENGVIYRGTRLNNWCSTLRTAISDIEVDYKTLEGRTLMKVPGHDQNKLYPFGVLTKFAYEVENSNERIVVATTRPETMLGDTAVAVHPDDSRYKHLHGKFVIHPFNGRRIPIITDPVLVDMSFGTGVVKITPAHDPNDFECGKRHNLPEINIFNHNGSLNENGAPFTGMMRFDCRVALVEALKEKGLFVGEEDNKMSVPLCSRSGDVIEPRLIPQWWVNCNQMAADAVKAVRTGELKIIPEEHKATWYDWLENIRDWCISRQLWWGHRIPAYQVIIDGKKPQDDDINYWVVGRTEQEALKKAKERFPKSKKIQLEQDPDVLDTWFSSGLFPFSTLGWPDKTPDMANFFPTSLLETGQDILFFWVARMVMMSQHLTGKLPFNEVYLHSMVRDKYGRKMSKSLGNVVDPLEVIDGCTLQNLHDKLAAGNLAPGEVEKAQEGQKMDFPQGIPACGTDALRFGLLAYTQQGQDINLDIGRIVGYRNFCNKLWNATILMRLSFPDLKLTFPATSTSDPAFLNGLSTHPNASLGDRWILSRLRVALQAVNTGFKTYAFGDAAHALYRFFIDELCPIYLELIKPAIKGTNEGDKDIIRKVLFTSFDLGFKLLHPMMPFLTEELWHRLPGREDSKESIMIQNFPDNAPESWANPEAETVMHVVEEIVHAVRSMKTEYKLQGNRPEVFIVARTQELQNSINAGRGFIQILAATGAITVGQQENAPKGCGISILSKDLEVHVNLTGLVDFEKEIEKLEKQKQEKLDAIQKLQKTMELPGYAEKAPPAKVEQDKTKLTVLNTELETIKNAIKNLAGML